MLFSYIDSVNEGVEFLIALGSIIGLLGVIFSILALLFGGARVRNTMVKVMIVSLILLVVCGLYTGIKYFRIY